MLQAQADEDDRDNHQHQQVVPQPQRGYFETKPVVYAAELQAEQVQRIHPGNALCAVGNVYRTVEVTHQDADNFAKAEGHYRQVVPAQLQRGRTE